MDIWKIGLISGGFAVLGTIIVILVLILIDRIKSLKRAAKEYRKHLEEEPKWGPPKPSYLKTTFVDDQMRSLTVRISTLEGELEDLKDQLRGVIK